MEMSTYTLTTEEAEIYDSGDDALTAGLMKSLRSRFGQIAGGRPITTEVRHPDGYVVEQYTTEE